MAAPDPPYRWVGLVVAVGVVIAAVVYNPAWWDVFS